MNARSEAILNFLDHGYWMTPSLIHENMVNVTWSYNTTLNRINDLTENGYLESHGEKKGWYKISEKGLETVD